MIAALTQENKLAVNKIARDLTVEKARQDKSIMAYKKDLGERSLNKIIAFFLKDLNDSININLKLNNEQILTLADELTNTYTPMKLMDFCLFFRRAKMGYFGNVYKLDMQMINEWIGKYEVEIENINYNEHLTRKPSRDDGRKSEPKLIKTLLKKWN